MPILTKMNLPFKKMFLFLFLLLLPHVVICVSKEDNASADKSQDKSEDVDFRKVNYPDEYNGALDPKRISMGGFLGKFRQNHLGFIHAFVASLSVIVVSELGDKTFFIAAIMAMRHPRLTVFLGASSALFIMTILSAFVGFATTVIPRSYTHYISTALFAIFGLKMLKEAYSMSPDEGQEEYEEVQKTVNKRETELDYAQSGNACDEESGQRSNSKVFRRRLMVCLSRVFLEAFTMTFLAEWGDRSQLATIILAAREDAIGVTLGAFLGHAACTGLAVLGGRMIAQRISVRTVTFVGAVTFIAFALTSLIMGPGGS